MRQIDHQTEHPGCRAAHPWDRSCTFWNRTETLIESARDDVRRMDLRDITSDLQTLRHWGDESFRRAPVRHAYIAHVEGYEDDEHERILDVLRRTFSTNPEPGRPSPRREADRAWTRTRGSLALAVLYAYRECIPEGIY